MLLNAIKEKNRVYLLIGQLYFITEHTPLRVIVLMKIHGLVRQTTDVFIIITDS